MKGAVTPLPIHAYCAQKLVSLASEIEESKFVRQEN